MRVPSPLADSTSIVPPCWETRLCTVARPSPVPLPLCFVEKKG